MPVRVLFAFWIALWGGSEAARAHEVKTKAGRVFEGAVVRQDDREVVIETSFEGTQRVARDEVLYVDLGVPPLREQLKGRAAEAETAKARWDLYNWAKKKGFEEQTLRYVLEGILDLAPEDKRARKLLGHEQVDGKWMSPEEKAAHLARIEEEQMRAKGLVRYEGEWVTPEEKDGRERGLKRDGTQWVTEEEWHLRQGERRVAGRMVKIGRKEGEAFCQEVVQGTRVDFQYAWSPHFDVVSEVKPDLAERTRESAEKAHAVMRSVLHPTEETYPHVESERVKLVLCTKAPPYVRFSQWLSEKVKAEELVPGWVRAVQRQHGYWWVQDVPLVGNYQFPNTDKTFVSNVLHNAAMVLLSRYRWADGNPGPWLQKHQWLREGFAYHVEMESIGYSDSFTLGRAGTGAGAGEQGPAWADSGQWRTLLKKLVAEGADPPLKRIVKMTQDMFGYEELVKSWSVVECLVRWDRKRFETFVRLTKEGEKEEEDALREAYGVDWRGLDQKWREYVAADYRHGG